MGQKLQKRVRTTSTTTYTDYQGGFHYENEVLKFFATAEGYVNVNAGRFSYIYNYTDHLGNIRLSYTKNTLAGNPPVIVDENNYYPFGLKHEGYNNISSPNNVYKYKYNGKEFQDELGLDYYDYGVRNYDPALGRWNRIDNKAEIYYALTPYNYAGNTPVQAIDVDGNLFIFVNGLMMEHWNAGRQSKYTSNSNGELINNPKYSPYIPDRGFYKDGARNNGKTFRYWTRDDGEDGVNLLYQRAYKDNNAYYTNGSFTPKSTAKTRFAEGAKAAADLIEKLESGAISLAEGETIKIVGHSQGAAYAAGLATELLKHSVYGSRIEFVDYIAAHQPKDFESPKGLLSRQFLTWSDWVVDGVMSDLRLNGGSENGCIKNVTDCQERKSHRGGRGGTFCKYLFRLHR